MPSVFLYKYSEILWARDAVSSLTVGPHIKPDLRPEPHPIKPFLQHAHQSHIILMLWYSDEIQKYRNEVGLRRYDLMGCGLGLRLGLKRRPSVILVGYYLIVARAALTITMVNFRTRVIMLIMKGNHLKSNFWTIWKYPDDENNTSNTFNST